MLDMSQEAKPLVEGMSETTCLGYIQLFPCHVMLHVGGGFGGRDGDTSHEAIPLVEGTRMSKIHKKCTVMKETLCRVQNNKTFGG